MNAKKQYEEFLDWLKAKREEISAIYWDEPEESRRIYRKLLLKVQSEAWTTEQVLRRLSAQTNN